MRSRYSAFALADLDYLSRTWHSSTRPDGLEIEPRQEWLGLKILSATGGIYDTTGTVEFVARYRLGRRFGELTQLSRFFREDGNWLYMDGQVGNENST